MKSSKHYNLNIILIFLIIIFNGNLYAQKDDQKRITKATLMSTVCPGLGQLYNKKYWKIPIIYTGLGAAIYFYSQNNHQYKNYQSAYLAETDDDPNTINNSNQNSSNLIILQDHYRDNRDLSAFLFILMYALNIVDASVDAHLLNYNVNDNLSLYLQPHKINEYENISLCVKFNL